MPENLLESLFKIRNKMRSTKIFWTTATFSFEYGRVGTDLIDASCRPVRRPRPPARGARTPPRRSASSNHFKPHQHHKTLTKIIITKLKQHTLAANLSFRIWNAPFESWTRWKVWWRVAGVRPINSVACDVSAGLRLTPPAGDARDRWGCERAAPICTKASSQ